MKGDKLPHLFSSPAFACYKFRDGAYEKLASLSSKETLIF